MSLLLNFPHKCTIRKRVSTKSTLGGRKNKPVNVTTNLLCWEQQASNAEILEFEKRGMIISKKIYFLSDPGVDEHHEILITERNGVAVSNPIRYDVASESLPDASAGLGVVYKVMINQNPAKLQ